MVILERRVIRLKDEPQFSVAHIVNENVVLFYGS